MAQEMEDNITEANEYAARRDRKMARNDLRKKSLIESQRQLKEDLSDDEAMGNADLMDNDSDEDGSGEDSDPEPEPLKELMDGQDVESEGHSDSDDGKDAFVNPLTAAKKKKTIDAKGEISEGEWSDEDDVMADSKGGNKK